MFIRIILAPALAIMLFGSSSINGFGVTSFRKSVSDKELPEVASYGNAPDK